MKHRVCLEPGCITILSSTNHGTFCWTHTPDIGSKLTSTYKPMRVTSEAFLANVPGSYDFTPEERRRYKRGGG